jgi:hypothetical protein
MRYVDPTTRKRPMWVDWWHTGAYGSDGRMIQCDCGKRIISKADMYQHWEQGHFDIYDEVKPDDKTTQIQKVNENNR